MGDSGFGGDEGIDDVEMPSVSTKIPLSKLQSFIVKEQKNGDKGFSQFDVRTVVSNDNIHVVPVTVLLKFVFLKML